LASLGRREHLQHKQQQRALALQHQFFELMRFAEDGKQWQGLTLKGLCTV
jgi:hypothetical protein